MPSCLLWRRGWRRAVSASWHNGSGVLVRQVTGGAASGWPWSARTLSYTSSPPSTFWCSLALAGETSLVLSFLLSRLLLFSVFTPPCLYSSFLLSSCFLSLLLLPTGCLLSSCLLFAAECDALTGWGWLRSRLGWWVGV